MTCQQWDWYDEQFLADHSFIVNMCCSREQWWYLLLKKNTITLVMEQVFPNFWQIGGLGHNKLETEITYQCWLNTLFAPATSISLAQTIIMMGPSLWYLRIKHPLTSTFFRKCLVQTLVFSANKIIRKINDGQGPRWLKNIHWPIFHKLNLPAGSCCVTYISNHSQKPFAWCVLPCNFNLNIHTW